MSETDDIEQHAAQWVTREDRGLTMRESEEMATWLAEIPHRVAYLRLKASWDASARLGALRHQSLPKRAWMPGWPRARYLVAAAAALVVLGGAGLAMQELKYWQTQEVIYATQSGERPTLHLVDGSQIQMDANSRLHASVSYHERLVTLEKGSAYFEVVHDAARPFVVLAGKHRIVDLGTKFSVQRNGDDVRVVVTEGRVQVDNVDTLSPTTPVFADGGNVVTARLNGTMIAPAAPKELSDALDWRQGRLTFNQATLAEAAEDFNRYNNRKLVVTSEARDIRIGGSFRADNLDAFIELARNSLGLRVAVQGNTIVLSKR